MNHHPICKLIIVSAIFSACSTSVGGDIAAGQKKSSACSSCHGVNGRGVDDNPPLAGINAEDLIALMQAYKTGGNTEPIMTLFMQAISDEDIANLAVYYASLPHAK